MDSYINEIRRKCIELKKKYGLTYAAIAQHSGVSYQTIRNFVCEYRDSMREDNWISFSKYIERTWNLFNEEGK